MWSIIRPSHLRCKYFIATAISYSQDISLAQANFIDKSTRRSKCFFLTPQTVIPLTGEMSRSDKRVIARNEQLEPVGGVVVQNTFKLKLFQTCDRSEILSCNCPWGGRCTLYFFLLTEPLSLPPAEGYGEPVNSRCSVVVSGGAGSGTI